MRVRATRIGFDGIQRRREGEEFDLGKCLPGSWMEPVDGEAKAYFAKVAKEAEAKLKDKSNGGDKPKS